MNGTITGSKTGSYYVFIEWKSTPDVETNTSSFTMRTYISHPKINISARTGSTTIDGDKASYKQAALDAGSNDRRLVNIRVKTIRHNDDGTKSIDVSASFPFDLDSTSHGRIRTKTASGTCVLDNIPRASEVSNHTDTVAVNGANAWSATMSKHAAAFWHKAVLKFGSYTHTVGPFDATGSYTIPMEWLKAIPNSKTGTATATIQTYSDSSCTTAIGDPVEKTFTIEASDSAKPVLSDGWVKLAAAYTVSLAHEVGGEYVQGYSKAKATFDDSLVSGQYGATIKSFKVSWDGAEAADSTKVLNKSGEQTVRCIATDSRGLSNYEDITITVQPYSLPTLSGISIYRSNKDSVADDAGTYIHFGAKANISSCNGKNGYWMYAYWEPTTQNDWGNGTDIGTGAGIALGDGKISTTTSYNAHIRIRDYLNHTASFTVRISTSEVAFHIKKGGKGAAFGKYAQTDNLLDVEWDIHSDGAISGEDGYRLDKLAISKAYADTEIGGGFKAYGASHVPTVYRAGPHVYLRGILAPTAKLAAGSTMYTLFTLPVWARPAGYIDVLGHGSGTAITWIRIAPEGTVTIGRYRSGDTYLDIETSYQLTLNAAWIAADAIT